MRGLAALALAGALAACSSPPVVPDAPIGGAPLLDDDGRMLVREPVIITETARGWVAPYPLERIYGTFGDCRDGGRRQHRGLDIGGVGPDFGVGTPVYSMVRARITFIGRGTEDPDQFGRPDTREGTTERGDHQLPRSGVVRGYGPVAFFTRDYGSWRSGDVIVTQALDGGIEGYQVRYMHLAAIHPELRVGDVVEAGQEIGLMGGTAVMHDLPHVHIDIEDLDGDRVDVAPFLGMEADRRRCR